MTTAKGVTGLGEKAEKMKEEALGWGGDQGRSMEMDREEFRNGLFGAGGCEGWSRLEQVGAG